MPFLFLFLLWPLLEIFAFAAVMDETGFFTAFFLAIGLMIAGGVLIQIQGLKTLETIQSALRKGQLPTEELFDQSCLFLAGFLLLLPGFLSDIVAVSLFFPPFRHCFRNVISRYFTGAPVGPKGFRHESEEAIDAEFIIVEDEDAFDRDRTLLP